MRIDKPRHNDHVMGINHAVGGLGKFSGSADLLDDIVTHKQRAIQNFATLRIKSGEDVCMVYEERSH